MFKENICLYGTSIATCSTGIYRDDSFFYPKLNTIHGISEKPAHQP